jgi:adenosylcobinamide-GDP ribazoletransferase
MGLLAALQFLTILPPFIRRAISARELGAAVGWFPFVGALLGLTLAILDATMALVIPPPLRSGLVLALWVLMTGALHLDGFLDTCDGLLGGWTPEKRLEIMHDEQAGSYALAGGVLLLLVKYGALLTLSQRWEALLLAPILGRWCMSLAIIAFPYARSDGMGRMMKDHAGWGEALFATGIALIAAWTTGHLMGLAVLALAAIAMWLVARFTLKRIPGMTGDVYGAVNEIVELLVLVIWVVIQYNF